MSTNASPISHEQLRALVTEERWHDICQITENMRVQDYANAGFHFFRGMALTKLAQMNESISVIRRGLALDPTSSWGNKLLFDAQRSNGQLDDAFREFKTFIESSEGHEAEKAWYVQWASELSLFEIAAQMNELRDVIRNVPPQPRFALALQCFNKADTLEKVFRTLVGLKDSTTFALVIIQDSVVDSERRNRYEDGFNAVRKIMSDWHHQLLPRFYSVEYIANSRNLGTAPTCRRILDHVSEKYAGFLFIEDDCLLAESALLWASYHLKTSISQDKYWFMSCESSFFDKEDRTLPEEYKERLERIANYPSLKNAYVSLDFVPSTCFGTTSAIWKTINNIRSFTRGPESLSRFIASRNAHTLAPVVPYAADIGMLHELGYSVANAGVANIREKKGTYLLANGPFDERDCHLYRGDKALLFRATSKLEEQSIRLIEERESRGITQ